MAAEATPEAESADFRLWPENVGAIDLFLAMSTQLRTAGINGRVIGLDYAVLPWVMRRLGIKRCDEAAVFRQLQIAEDELLRTT